MRRFMSLRDALLVASMVLNIALTWRLLDLKRQSVPRPGELKLIDSIALTSTLGESRRMTFDAKQTVVLYFFAPDCAWCDVNLNNLTAMVREVGSRTDVRVVPFAPVSTVALREYQRSKGLKFELYSVDPEEAKRLGFAKTPTTAAIGLGGQVLLWSVGAYDVRTQGEIGSLLGVRLPGLVRSD